MKATIVKINKTKIWFFKKINKIEKPLARLIMKKRKEESNQQMEKNQKQTTNQQIRNENGEVITGNAEIQRINRLLLTTIWQ